MRRRAVIMRTWQKWALGVVAVLAVLFVAIQFVPYGRPITTPPVTDQFKWSSPEAAAISKKACNDCHSNDPQIWWAVKIAPISWMAQSDATQGRSAMDFSAWTGYPGAAEFAQAVDSGRMPPMKFWIVHPDAKLTAAEKQTLIDGFKASLALNHAQTVPSDVSTIIKSSCGSCHPASLAMALFRQLAGSGAELGGRHGQEGCQAHGRAGEDARDLLRHTRQRQELVFGRELSSQSSSYRHRFRVHRNRARARVPPMRSRSFSRSAASAIRRARRWTSGRVRQRKPRR